MANRTHDTQVQSFEQAARFLAAGRDKDRRPLTGRSTELRRIDEHTIAVRYHATDVVTFHDDHRITLDSGGWFTMTTKERIGTYAPISIARSNGLWYMFDYRKARRFDDMSTLPIFFDGIECDDDGMLLNARPVDEQVKAEAAKRTIDRLVSRYIKGFEAEARAAGELALPSNGDCWDCAMREAGTDKPLGDVTGDVSHLLEHLQESYFVPSLLYNAINERWFGGGVGMIWSMLDGDIARGRSDLFHLRSSLRQYFRSRKVRLAELLAHQEEVTA